MTEEEYERRKDEINADPDLDYVGRLYMTMVVGVQYGVANRRDNEPFHEWELSKIKGIWMANQTYATHPKHA